MSKISELTAAAALTGDEIVPVVQTGATVRTTIGDLLDSGAYVDAAGAAAAAPVQSVNTETGDVVLGAADVGADPAGTAAGEVAAIPSDGPAGTASLRTLGTGATQAAAGDDARLTDERTPVDDSVTVAKLNGTVTGSADDLVALDGTGGFKGVDSGAYVTSDDDAATLGSGAAADGTVLTADGLGGAAFEAVSGGDIEAIAEVTLASDASSVSFTSIPGTFRNLRMIVHARVDGNVSVRFNDDTGANYDVQRFIGYATTLLGQENLGAGLATLGTGGDTAGVFDTYDVLISNYAASDRQTSLVAAGQSKSGTATGNVRIRTASAYWRTNAAVTKITVLASTIFRAGTVVTLYGIKGA